MTYDVTFEYSRTLLMIATYRQHKLPGSARNTQTSTTENYAPEHHFNPIIVPVVDKKCFSGRMKAHAVHPTHQVGEPWQSRGKLYHRELRNSVNVKIGVFGGPERHARCESKENFSVPIEAGVWRVHSDRM